MISASVVKELNIGWLSAEALLKLSHTGKGQTKKIKRFHYIQNAVSQ